MGTREDLEARIFHKFFLSLGQSLGSRILKRKENRAIEIESLYAC